ncbi:hypothetical protein EW146_g243 [Bondarzewia mesenterica]|uniref:Uncharacterized protein n=1 Tax=Bondarzewia mesenterica TaxID=1095465 RepID=A0A4V6S1L6_9AGAM|nr:hypothetical protein EW146_g243 [Bondarzewia mesenterica]
MGVRYNAEKKKIGNYYSTPIFSFRCKCHLCRARQKDEDWDPEENGGYAVHGMLPYFFSFMPDLMYDGLLRHGGKGWFKLPVSSSSKTHPTITIPIPIPTSLRVRKRFREEKKVEKQKEEIDKEIKERYALPSELKLIRDDDESVQEAKDAWAKARSERVGDAGNKRRKLDLDRPLIASNSWASSASIRGSVSGSKGRSSSSSGSSSSDALSSLRARILSNTVHQLSILSPSPASRKKPPNITATGISLRKD